MKIISEIKTEDSKFNQLCEDMQIKIFDSVGSIAGLETHFKELKICKDNRWCPLEENDLLEIITRYNNS